MGGAFSKAKEVKQKIQERTKPKQSRPQQSVPTNEPRIVQCIPEGTGGTFWLRYPGSRHHKPKHGIVHELNGQGLVRTEYCKAGVGVYFAIGDNLCFCAHIHATVEGPRSTRKPTPGENARIADQVRTRLEVESEGAEWSLKDVRKASLRLVCTQGQFGGAAAAEGVLDFLYPKDPTGDGAPGYRPVSVSNTEHGFVTVPFWPKDPSLPGGRRWLMPYYRQERAEGWAYRSLSGFRMVYEKLPPDWTFSCLDGWTLPKKR